MLDTTSTSELIEKANANFLDSTNSNVEISFETLQKSHAFDKNFVASDFLQGNVTDTSTLPQSVDALFKK